MKVFFAFSIPTSKGTKTLNMKCLRKRKCNQKLGARFWLLFIIIHRSQKEQKKNYHILSKNHVKKFSQFQANFTYLDNNKKIFLGKYIIIGWTIHLKKRKLSLKINCLLALDIKKLYKKDHKNHFPKSNSQPVLFWLQKLHLLFNEKRSRDFSNLLDHLFLAIVSFKFSLF